LVEKIGKVQYKVKAKLMRNERKTPETEKLQFNN